MTYPAQASRLRRDVDGASLGRAAKHGGRVPSCEDWIRSWGRDDWIRSCGS